MLLDDWHSRGIAFVTLGEGIDMSTPAGRLVAGVLGSIAEFERARIQERVRAGLARVRAQGRRLGRKPCAVSDDRFAAVANLSTRQAAQRLGISHTVVARWRAVNKTPPAALPETPDSPVSA
jgi:DNA invertase Pin-like site-specific DNA recombinase